MTLVWKDLGPIDDRKPNAVDRWDATKVYTLGNIVNYQAHFYKVKYFMEGEEEPPEATVVQVGLPPGTKIEKGPLLGLLEKMRAEAMNSLTSSSKVLERLTSTNLNFPRLGAINDIMIERSNVLERIRTIDEIVIEAQYLGLIKI